jgi:hypothetical protein
VAPEVLYMFASVVACVFVADALSGLFHWLEDSYGNEDWPILGPLVTQANVLHHFDPRHMTRHSWFASARVPLLLCSGVLVPAYFLHALSWQVGLIALLMINSNEVHKWAHRTKAENGRLIHFAQTVGLLQSRAHHARHHQGRKDSHYCVLTNVLNPILDGIGVWRHLESVLQTILGLRCRVDPSVGTGRRSYPVPPCTNGECGKASLEQTR